MACHLGRTDPPLHDPQRLARLHRDPGFIDGEWLGAHDGDHISWSGELSEIHRQIVIRQARLTEGGLAGEQMEPGGGIHKQPAPIAQQPVEGAPLGQPIGKAGQMAMQIGPILR